jgi:hypothetical protein
LANDITEPLLYATLTTYQNIKNYTMLREYYQEKQKIWIKDVLENSECKWKIVCGHYPIISTGPHILSQQLQEFLKPLFNDYRVDFYLSGHDHNLQHLIEANTQYIIAGAFSSFSFDYDKSNKRLCKFVSKEAGFVKFEIRKNTIFVEFIGVHGKLLHNFSCTKL